MLNNLEIRNFQSHKSSTLNFHPGMNVITGTSDSGKSAIIRALIWALKNRPSGGDFKTWSTKADAAVEVSLEFDNDWFTKSRLNGKNKYETDDGFYEALRHDVPQPINDIANIADYNIQTQFQSYFMLQDSPGDRAKQLNQLVGLDIVDRVLKKLGQKAATNKQQIKIETERINKAQDALIKFDHIPSVELLLVKMMKDIDTREKLSGEMRTVSESLSKISDFDRKIAEHEKITHAKPLVSELKLKISKSQTLNSDIKTLMSLIGTLRKTSDTLKADTEWLAVEKPYKKLMPLISAQREKTAKLLSLQTLVNNLKKTEANLEAKQNALREDIARYTEILGTAGVCPTCKSKINKSVMANILMEMQNETT